MDLKSVVSRCLHKEIQPKFWFQALLNTVFKKYFRHLLYGIKKQTIKKPYFRFNLIFNSAGCSERIQAHIGRLTGASFTSAAVVFWCSYLFDNQESF